MLPGLRHLVITTILLILPNIAVLAQDAAYEPRGLNPLRPPLNTASAPIDASSALSEQVTTSSTPAEATPVSVDSTETLTDSGQQPATAAKIQESIDATKNREGLEETAKEEIIQRYQAALALLNEVAEVEQKLKQYQTEVSEAAERIKDAKQKLAKPQPDVTLDVPNEATLPQIEEQLHAAQLELKETQQELNAREEEVKGRGERKSEIAKLLGGTKQRLEEATKQLGAAPPAGEAAEMTQARRSALRTRISLLSKQIELYHAEARRMDALAELFPLLRDLAKRGKNASETRVTLYQQLVSKQRRLESEQQAREAQRQLKMTHHPDLMRLAERNSELADRRKAIAELISRVSAKVKQVDDDIERLRIAFQMAEDRVEKAGHSTTVGLMLRKQREALPDTRRCIERLKFVEREMPPANLDQMDLEEERSSLGDISEATLKVVNSLPAEDRAHGGVFLEHTVRDLLNTKAELLTKLVIDLDTYLAELSKLEVRNRELIQQRSKFATFIGENVLWIRSAEPFAVRDLTSAAAGMQHLASPASWIQLTAATGLDTVRRPQMAGAVLLCVALLILFHARLRRRISHLCTSKACQSGLRFLPTLEAILLSAIISSEWPLLMWFFSWRMIATNEVSDFAYSVGTSLQYVAILLFLSGFVRELCRSNGVAESFFKWPAHGTRIARRQTWWLSVLGLPMAAATSFSQTFQQGDWANSLGRLAFILAMLVLAGFTHFLLRTKNNVLSEAISRQPQGWLNCVRNVCYAMGTGVPLCLAGLAAIGFYYSAQHLAIRLQTTLGMIFAVILAHAMISRWFLLKRRALAMQQVKERQQLAAEAETIDASGSTVPPADTLPDLTEIHGKLRLLLRYALTVIVFLTMWMIWSDVLPAFRVLDRVVFWVKTVPVVETIESADGTKTTDQSLKDVPTTLRHGLMAALLLLTTFALGKYLPALLEITILNRLPLDRGGRHAISVILHYTVALTGVLLAGRIMNITWSSIQWLAAGMTVGLGFGLQEIFANFVSGLILLFERPIRVGDVITLGDVTGTVSDIRIRATTVTNWDRKELIVPNRALITGSLLNWTLSDKTNRIVIELGLSYSTDARVAREIILQTVKEHENVLTDPAPNVTFEGFGNSTLTFIVRAYVATLDVRLATVNDLHAALHARLRSANIEIAFPQLDLNVRRVPAEIGSHGIGMQGRSDAA